MLFDVTPNLYVSAMDEETVTLTPIPGSSVNNALKEAKLLILAAMTSKQIIVRFNGVDIYVNKDTDINQALDAYDAGLTYHRLNKRAKK